MLIYGDRVRSARLLRGIGSGELADAAGWSSATQSRLESTASQDVPIDGVEQLSRKLEMPLRFFGTVPPPTLSSTELLFRAPVRTTKREKSYLVEYARLVGEVLDWLDQRHRLPPVKLPTLSISVKVEDAAQRTRTSLDLDHEQPISHLTHRAERAGVTVVVRDAANAVGALWSLDEPASQILARTALREDHHAYSARVGELRGRPLVVQRAHKSWERTRLTVAHELGHLVLHSRELPPDAEKQAYDFASELLAPASTIVRHLPRPVTLAGLIPVKMHFGISLGALINHLLRSKLITEQRFDTLSSQLYRRRNADTGITWGKQEPGWDSQAPERPKLLSTWLERCAGSADPGALSASSLAHVPADLIASMVSGQRKTNLQPPVKNKSPQSKAEDPIIVDLSSRRAR